MTHLILYETTKIKSGFKKCTEFKKQLNRCLENNIIDDCKIAVNNYKKCLALNEIPYYIIKKSKDKPESQ